LELQPATDPSKEKAASVRSDQDVKTKIKPKTYMRRKTMPAKANKAKPKKLNKDKTLIKKLKEVIADQKLRISDLREQLIEEEQESNQMARVILRYSKWAKGVMPYLLRCDKPIDAEFSSGTLQDEKAFIADEVVDLGLINLVDRSEK